jgi:ethanolamine utilization protein EutQ (cupin superfamily)
VRMLLSNEAPDARPVRKFTIQDAQDWMEWSGVSLSDVVNEDETPGVKLGGVGFSRGSKGATTNFEFTYDEVLVITKGTCTVRTENETITAQVSEVIYLPARTPGVFQADEDAELVYVATSPYGEVNREMKASLLNRKG